MHVRRLEASLQEDFYKLHHPDNGEGWCNCVAWWVPSWEGWEARTSEQNRAVRDALFESNEFDGYLLYEAERPIGWCQCGPQNRLSKLTAQLGLEPDADVWAMSLSLIHI